MLRCSVHAYCLILYQVVQVHWWYSVDGVRSRFKEFKEPSVFKQSSNEVKGEQSLVAYKTLANERENVQELRNCGLRDDEIELWMSQFEKQVGDSVMFINVLFTCSSLQASCMCVGYAVLHIILIETLIIQSLLLSYCCLTYK